MTETKIPHNLEPIVREVLARRLVMASTSDRGVQVIIMTCMAARLAADAGVDLLLYSDAAKAIAKLTYENLGRGDGT